MDIRIYQNNDAMLVRLSGRVVLDECDRLKNAVIGRINPGITRVHLDLSDVEFIDSAGLGALVGMKVRSNKNRATLSLLSPSKGVSDILVVSKLDSIFDILEGNEAQRLIAELAQQPYLISGSEAAEGENASAQSPAFQEPPAASAVPAASSSASPKERIDQLCKTAVEYMRQRDYDRASECYREVLSLDGDYLPALNNLAIVCEKKPQWHGEAIELWQKVLDLSQSKGDSKHVERAQKHLNALQGA